ncbi:hypothetical protein [Deinococcus marmoris]|nr:hypothetical protein [Deinococcus marmoris]
MFVASFPEHDPSEHEQEGPQPAVLVGLPLGGARPGNDLSGATLGDGGS